MQPYVFFSAVLLSIGDTGSGRPVAAVLVGEESANLVLKPELVPRPLVVAVDRDHRERLAGGLPGR